MENLRNLRRIAASQYLKIRWNVDRKPQTLARLASRGGGPRFFLIGRVPYYTEEELDAWVRSITSPPLTATRAKPPGTASDGNDREIDSSAEQ